MPFQQIQVAVHQNAVSVVFRVERGSQKRQYVPGIALDHLAPGQLQAAECAVATDERQHILAQILVPVQRNHPVPDYLAQGSQFLRGGEIETGNPKHPRIFHSSLIEVGFQVLTGNSQKDPREEGIAALRAISDNVHYGLLDLEPSEVGVRPEAVILDQYPEHERNLCGAFGEIAQ
uniref:Uncharacterized protein n=1 Tax=Candidatus Kentrum sp. LPFa TaxID=2126335 RepID=A0A450VTJ6_9GAMM|nr:MAG: hypothetical protein BECKLPF1236A_GA0070988_100138 [Candidatus Kentron sp. LPFa]VFK23233.1 MAG: hypothetical protein BECKLPF1236C_GA0070990_1000417 [Candidatus Kentron sp. LPFa]